MEVAQLLKVLAGAGVQTVGALRKIATPENLELIRNMCRRSEGREPDSFELMTNLVNLAGSGQKRNP